MRIHGNYVGPNWSAGKRQSSVRYGKVRAIDEFDLSGKFHDHAYASGMDKKKADYLFYKWNIGKGPVRTAAALAVGAQGFFRAQKNNNMRLPVTPMSLSKTNKYFRPKQTATRGPISVQLRKLKRRKLASKTVRRTVVIRGKVGKSLRTKGRRMSGKLSAVEKAGTVEKQEFYGNIVSSTCCYVGHITHCRTPIFRSVARAIVKMIASRAGVNTDNFDFALSAGNAGDIWKLLYKLNYDAATPASIHQIVTLPGYTLNDVANNFASFLTNNLEDQIVLLNGFYIPAVGTSYAYTEINLKDASIYLSVKSAMKLQNRTVSQTASRSTDVIDVNPVIGKSYEGSGTGTQFVSGTFGQIPLIGEDSVIGSITLDGSTGQVALKEPPSGKQFTNVKKGGGQRIDPGEIRTSYLNSSKWYKLNRLIQMLGPNSANHPMLSIGKFRFFALEKLMYDGGELAPLVTIGFEIQGNVASYLGRVFPQQTAQIVIASG